MALVTTGGPEYGPMKKVPGGHQQNCPRSSPALEPSNDAMHALLGVSGSTLPLTVICVCLRETREGVKFAVSCACLDILLCEPGRKEAIRWARPPYSGDGHCSQNFFTESI